MATIAFMLDHEEGHLLPTFKLARQLRARGHNVYYLGLADGGDFVRRQGFDFIPILEHVFPKGTMRTLRDFWWTAANGNGQGNGKDGANGKPEQKEWYQQDGDAGEILLYERYLGALVRGESLDGVIRTLQPDLLILNTFLAANALVLHYRYRIPIVLLTPYLRTMTKAQHAAGIEGALLRLRSGADDFFTLVRRADPTARRFSDLSAHFMRMPELILCPQDLEVLKPGQPKEQEVFYGEASVDLDRKDDREFPWDQVDPAKRLLYCSLGSQSFMGGKDMVSGFLQAVTAVIAAHPEWQLILSTGGLLRSEDFPTRPADAILSPWVPQLQVLERAAVMITHGGLGTLKECIFRGVPVVVFPISRDQPDNAKRVDHHRLGLGGDLASFTPQGIFSLVQQVADNPEYRRNMERMRSRFLEAEESGVGVKVIEDTLRRHGRLTAAAASAPTQSSEARAY
jgi:zeaxanthin glucosyltransferase